jgi:hypothetical protein
MVLTLKLTFRMLARPLTGAGPRTGGAAHMGPFSLSKNSETVTVGEGHDHVTNDSHGHVTNDSHGHSDAVLTLRKVHFERVSSGFLPLELAGMFFLLFLFRTWAFLVLAL